MGPLRTPPGTGVKSIWGNNRKRRSESESFLAMQLHDKSSSREERPCATWKFETFLKTQISRSGAFGRHLKILNEHVFFFFCFFYTRLSTCGAAPRRCRRHRVSAPPISTAVKEANRRVRAATPSKASFACMRIGVARRGEPGRGELDQTAQLRRVRSHCYCVVGFMVRK